MFTSMLRITLLFTLCCLLCTQRYTQACSSRTVPKPRPSTSSSSSISATASPRSTTAAPTTTTTTSTTTTTTTTVRPNITFPTYKCPETYDAWYCLNEATCFSVKIGDSIMYNCECAIGFMGPRCEYKELDGSYLPKRPRPMLEKASIASGATCALLFMLFVCLTLYLRYDQKPQSLQDDEEADKCEHCVCCYNERTIMGVDGSSDTDLLVNCEKYRYSTSLRQHFATLPIMSLAFKRSNKL